MKNASDLFVDFKVKAKAFLHKAVNIYRREKLIKNYF